MAGDVDPTPDNHRTAPSPAPRRADPEGRLAVSTAPLFGPELTSRYIMGEEIGRGGCGTVYRAQQKATGQDVAVKIIRPSSRSKVQWSRFVREARLCGALHHPHIVRIIDAHEGQQTAWSVFEFVPGRDLATVLADGGRLEPAIAVRLMSQVLDALAAAHAQGIVHRDIKPSNIMVTHTGARPNAQVLDFGIGSMAIREDVERVARTDGSTGGEAPADEQAADSLTLNTLSDDGLDVAMGAADESAPGLRSSQPGDGIARVTRDGEMLGTPAYAAPEQLLGEQATTLADLYSWALMFVECLTGERVIPGRRLSQIIMEQLAPRPVVLPEALRAHRLGPILERALSKKPEERTVSARSLLSALDLLDPTELAALSTVQGPSIDGPTAGGHAHPSAPGITQPTAVERGAPDLTEPDLHGLSPVDITRPDAAPLVGVLAAATHDAEPDSDARPGHAPSLDAGSTRFPLAEDDQALLARVPMLRRLTVAELTRLSSAMYRRPLAAGQLLAEIGDSGDDGYIVRSGELVLELPLDGRDPQVIARMGPGTIVGEVCLIEPAPRSLRMRAGGPTEVFIIDGQKFATLCSANDAGAHKVLRYLALTLCDRLRQTSVRMQRQLRDEGAEPPERSGSVLLAPLERDRPWHRLKQLFTRWV